jgi:hypothetical protein
MPLTVTVITLTVLVLFNMALSFAIIRRLREHEDRFGTSTPVAVGGPEPGDPMPAVETRATDGSPVRTEALRGRRTLIGFFSTTCSACTVTAPRFSEEARKLTGEGIQVIAVLSSAGNGDDAALRGMLGQSAQLVVEAPGGVLATAFSPRALPSFFLVDPQGRVAAKGLTMDSCLSAAAS